MVLSRKGQSTIEYLLVFAAIIGVAIVLVAQPGSIYQNRLNETYDTASNSLVTASNAFFKSF